MQNRGFSKAGLCPRAMAGVLAGMLMILGCGGGDGEEETTKVAASDTAASTSAELAQTIKAVDGQPFRFQDGVGTAIPALATQTTTLTFTDTSSANPTFTLE